MAVNVERGPVEFVTVTEPGTTTVATTISVAVSLTKLVYVLGGVGEAVAKTVTVSTA